MDYGPPGAFEAEAACGRPRIPRRFSRGQGAGKSRFTNWLRSESGQIVDPQTIFDCQVKRIHEYKRQLLNALRIIVEYNRLFRLYGGPFASRADAEATARQMQAGGGALPVIVQR